MKAEIADLVAEVETLKAQLATANENAAKLKDELDAAVKDRHDTKIQLSDAEKRIETLTAEKTALTDERDIARAEVAKLTEANTSLVKSQSEFDAKVAAKVAQLGISQTSLPVSSTAKPLSLTEQCLASKGK